MYYLSTFYKNTTKKRFQKLKIYLFPYIILIVERKVRYLDKLAHIDRRISNIESWLPLSNEERTRLAIYKAFQEIVEALFDIISMSLVDLKIPPKDDYTNLNNLEEKGLIDKELVNIMRKANGLRNRLIHRYNILSEEITLESIKNLLPELKKVRRNIESWI
jgi:uncharacterized protein YutE (UPF0331/DUF86 family)